MRKALVILFFLFNIPGQSFSQYINQPASSEILLSLQKLKTVGSVLYVAAHPDDENTRLLGYLSKEKKLRTAYISITRGDGGQNLIGKEQGDLLGLIRTQELLAARKTDGAEQFFTRANDFGYSKNPEETFSFWNRDSVLADVVWVIRNFKPDVIITRFPTTGEGGHGHHTASAILAEEAFEAAADPKRFPWQLKYTETWQAKRVFWNTFNFGGNNTTSPDQLKIDVGAFNPLLGKGYGEIAAESRSMHKSQGFGAARTRGTMIEYFKQLKGDAVTADIFEGIDQSWKRIKGTERIEYLIDSCIQKYSVLEPSASIPGLVEIYKAIQLLPEGDGNVKYWKAQKLLETTQLILASAGIWLEAAAAEYSGVPGEKIALTTHAICRNKSDVKLSGINYFGFSDTLTNLSLKHNELLSFKHEDTIPPSVIYSTPYWLSEKHETGFFKIKDPLLIGTPENVSSLNVQFKLIVHGLSLNIIRPLVFKSTDPVKGEVYRPFEVLPPATVNISEKVFVFGDHDPKPIRFRVKANKNDVKGMLKVKAPEGWFLTLKNYDFNLKNKGDEAVFEGSIHPINAKENASLVASLRIDEKEYTKSIQRIEYDHIPYQFVLSDAEAKLIRFDLKKASSLVGYIPGAGDDIPACLSQIGYNVTELTDDLLSTADLSVFPAIVTGVRAYNTSDRLQLHYNKLMEYVKQGGNLIVQYNTNNRIGPVKANIGPYPFTISRERVTDEKADVRFLLPDHPALTFPNVITNKDFDNWIQERGIYFATEVDSNYQSLLSMNDPNEKSFDGGLIVAKYGKGNFVYTGLSFFRQLPAGVPGAYRLFVNLLSLPGE
jgi:LmbE family N-acetylglucosaminyl deacetylase